MIRNAWLLSSRPRGARMCSPHMKSNSRHCRVRSARTPPVSASMWTRIPSAKTTRQAGRARRRSIGGASADVRDIDVTAAGCFKCARAAPIAAARSGGASHSPVESAAAREPPSSKETTHAADPPTVSTASSAMGGYSQPGGASSAAGRSWRALRSDARRGLRRSGGPTSTDRSPSRSATGSQPATPPPEVDASGRGTSPHQMWIGLPVTAIAASLSASACVGCAWQV